MYMFLEVIPFLKFRQADAIITKGTILTAKKGRAICSLKPSMKLFDKIKFALILKLLNSQMRSIFAKMKNS